VEKRNPGDPVNYDAFHKASVFDPPNQWCLDIVRRFADDHEVIFVSGREEKYRPITLDWLSKYAVCGFKKPILFMRSTNDFRPDFLIKKIIYEEHIKGTYKILFVIDDRKQVVDMWRAEGLTVLHCAEGDF